MAFPNAKMKVMTRKCDERCSGSVETEVCLIYSEEDMVAFWWVSKEVEILTGILNGCSVPAERVLCHHRC